MMLCKSSAPKSSMISKCVEKESAGPERRMRKADIMMACAMDEDDTGEAFEVSKVSEYDQIIGSQSINGSFNTDFFSIFKIGEILTELDSMFPDKEILQKVWATIVALAILERKFGD